MGGKVVSLATTENEETPAPTPGNEIAVITNGMDITRGYVDRMLYPTYANSILLTHGAQDVRMYEEILRDDQVKTCMEQRIKAVTGAAWRVDAGGEDAIDTEAAEALQEDLKQIGWDNVTDKMLYGTFYGYAVAELLWEAQERLAWKSIRVRDRARFRFDTGMNLRLLTSTNMLDGVEAHDRYFWHLSTGATHDDEPYGIGLGHWLYWPTYFKRHGQRSWNLFLEKYAQPTAWGKFPSGTDPDDKVKLLQALKSMQNAAAFITPDGMQVELVQAIRSAGADYDKAVEYFDDAIARVIVGQTMTTRDGSSRSQSETHYTVRQDIVKADADLINESFACGPGKLWTMLNFPGAKTPTLVREIEEDEDLDARSQRDSTLHNIGVRLTEDGVREVYGDQYEQTESGPVPPRVGTTLPEQLQQQAANFAEGDRDRPKELTEQLETEVESAIEGLIAEIGGVWEGADSHESLLEGLARAFPDLGLVALAHKLQDGIAAAEIAGRHDALEDSDEL